MEIVFISGWATNRSIWDKVKLEQNLPAKYLEWSDVLKESYTLPSECILVGWSLGGQLALNMLHHKEVKGILLVSSMCNITSKIERPGVNPNLFKQIVMMLKRSRSGYLNSFFKQCGANEEELNELMKQAESFTDSELVDGLKMMFKEEVTPARTLPATIIHGTSDLVIPHECSEYIFEKYLYQCTSLFPVNGGKHLIPMTHPERIIEAVNELVERVNS